MKSAWMLAVMLAACLARPAAAAEVVSAVPMSPKTGSFGAGVIAGDPTGLTVKYWLDGGRALDAGVGFSGDAAFYLDFLWHDWSLLPQPEKGRLGAYAALGPRVETQRDTAFGIRAMGGMGWWLPMHPIELFAELGPVFRLSPDRDVDFDGGLGVRIYFGGSRIVRSTQ